MYFSQFSAAHVQEPAIIVLPKFSLGDITTPDGRGVLATNGVHTIMPAQLHVTVRLRHPAKIS